MAVVEGKNAVIEALKGDRTVTEILLAAGSRRDERLDEIWDLAAKQGITIRTVNRRELDAMSVRGAHQGIVARLQPFHFKDLGEIIDGLGAAEDAIVVVADGVTDPQNLGAMIRTCEAAGAAAFVIGKHRSAHITAVTVKAAAGATEHLPIVQATNVSAALDALKKAGFWVFGTDDEAETDLWDADLTGRAALAFGSEGKGLARLVRERCDVLLRIPVLGQVGSLNVSAATAVAVYEALRQRGIRSRGTP